MTLRNFSAYALLLVLFGAGIYLVLDYGQSYFATSGMVAGKGEAHATLLRGLREPLSILLIQIIVVIVAARLMGAVFVRLRQPAVIGEILAGILLGPSLLGYLSPTTMAFLFPPDSLESLKLLSQVGVLLFMFVVGMDLDLRHFRQKAQSVIVISHSSIALPFALGVVLALGLYKTQTPAGTSFIAFGLFMGIALSITAFPVLARILSERGLTDTALGRTAISCAAVDDVTAWCLLALVVAVVQASGIGGAFITLALAAAFIFIMLAWLRPWMEGLIERLYSEKNGNSGLVSGVLVLAFACAAFAEIIGINALFGAFLAGVVIPAQTRFREFLHARIETFSAFLMPLFFAFTGLRTQIGLLNEWQDWAVCAGIIVVAVIGKLCGGMFAARWTGMPWRNAFIIGALMNTRGLMELVVLNIGYDLGILSAQIFAMLVIMTLVTTFMTGPLIGWVREKSV